ncbi:hypothetical protein M2102_003289 [Fusobacterium sp. PH5-7]|uniref:hypothetical protein n=1 Tax=Fusobacterium sp. PH5-7 TaxID=2940528 RepID=UPI002473216F|nr:hypothetical protein [Fusobacterium sp. PH5-7]MDH6459627.1 hypothetical protein [Fusobacterium sp. PH5-7]
MKLQIFNHKTEEVHYFECENFKTSKEVEKYKNMTDGMQKIGVEEPDTRINLKTKLYDGQHYQILFNLGECSAYVDGVSIFEK